MKIKLKLGSKTFKRSYNSEDVELDRDEKASIYLYQDENIPTIKGKDENEYSLMSMDYGTITRNSSEIDDLTFCNIPTDIIVKLLKDKGPTQSFGLYNGEIDVPMFDGVNTLRDTKELRLYSITSKEGKRSRFMPVTTMEKLEKLCINNNSCIDINALLEDIPNPENITSISLGYETPDPDILARLTNLRSVIIQNVDDANKFQKMLDALPLENIEELIIVNCNMQEVSPEMSSRLESLKNIRLKKCLDANYNEILDHIPNKDILDAIEFSSSNENYELQADLLPDFQNLKQINLDNLKIDEDKLHEYLLGANLLEVISMKKVDLPKFDFFKGIDKKIEVLYQVADLDYIGVYKSRNPEFVFITPEEAKKHSSIKISDPNGFYIQTTSDKPDGFEFSFSVDCASLYFIKDLLAKLDKIDSAKVDVPKDSNGINQIDAFLIPYSDKCVGDGYQIVVDDFSKLEASKIKLLDSKRRLKKITVVDRHGADTQTPERYSYEVDKYTELEQKIKEVTADIPENLSDLQKFMIIYRRIGTRVVYDYGIVGENEYSDYAKQNADDCRNMTNGLLRNTCVCAGYADILYNCLRKVGINTYKINGLSGEYHQWNKVELDGKMYNTDLTWDAPSLSTKRNLEYCLRGDAEFGKKHRKTVGFEANCPEDYNRREVRKALNFAREFDGVRLPTIFDKIKNRFFNKKKALPVPQSPEATDKKIAKKPSWEISEEDRKKVNNQLSHNIGLDETEANHHVEDIEK